MSFNPPPYNPSYLPQQQGYPQQQQGYPPQQQGSQQQGYPPLQQGYPVQQPVYPAQLPGYPMTSYTQQQIRNYIMFKTILCRAATLYPILFIYIKARRPGKATDDSDRGGRLGFRYQALPI